MVDDACAAHVDERENELEVDDEPNEEAKVFFELLESVNRPLWPGCSQSELSTAVRLLSIKADGNIPQHSMDEMITLMRDTNISPEHLPEHYYDAKRLVQKLGLKAVKIDCCESGCMLYYKDDADEMECKYCGKPRFKEVRGRSRKGKPVPRKRMHYIPIIPRLQRLFSSMRTAPHMRWHAEHRRVEGVMVHPSDGAAWKYFDQKYADHFASDPRNVRLGLCADGFNPFGQSGSNYSCWPVILTPYNLPPEMCMTAPFMFLTCIIPGPRNPKNNIDVFLQPLIDDLLYLWNTGEVTYDVSLRQNFTLRAALMWTINDFPAYGMLSGWQTAGKLACPCCMEHSKAFTLQNGGKSSWFDCHRQFLPEDHPLRRSRYKFTSGRVEKDPPPTRLSSPRVYDRVSCLPKVTTGSQFRITGYGTDHKWTKRSIFWDLPYWKDNMLRHNLDVMHIEKNVFDNVCNTVMDVKGKTKDNEKSRRDLELICRRPELHLIPSGNGNRCFKPKAIYTLTKDQQNTVCEWIRSLRLPDGYASNLSRCVDMAERKLHGLKSHDCHVLMQCLLPIMFKSLPTKVWEALTELSTFFKDLCCTTLRADHLYVMEKNIPITLCKLELMFPPSFFDVMEHLPVHLPYEAWAGGPVQYRWMYPFERYLGKLKRTIMQKARIEGSICEAYLSRETSNFVSYYFEPHVQTSLRRVGRNDDDDQHNTMIPTLSIFNQPGRSAGVCKTRWLTDREVNAAHLHVLINCVEVQPFIA